MICWRIDQARHARDALAGTGARLHGGRWNVKGVPVVYASTSLALWEIGPPTVAAIIAGTIFGALVPLVVLAAVDLRPFTGSSVAPAYRVDPAILALTLGGFVVVAAALTALTLLVSRRIRAAGALRTVEEG